MFIFQLAGHRYRTFPISAYIFLETTLEHHTFNVSSIAKDKPLEEVPKLEMIARLYTKLNILKPDAIAIAGYSNPAMLAALGWSLRHHKPAILMSASKEDDFPRSPITEYLKRWLIKAFKAALVGGKPQQRYLVKLGKPIESVFTGYNVIGNDTFHPSKTKCLPPPLTSPYFLSVNRFIPKKNLPLLINAYALYRQTIPQRSDIRAWELVLSGDGKLRSNLEKQIKDLGLENTIHLTGFLQQKELLPYYAHASCFIHASVQEQWGLVVNEAMATGLPVIVSNRCGCFEDLMLEGVNGFGFNPENVEQLAMLMLKVSCGKLDIGKMGQASP